MSTLSVVIAARNAADRIEGCILSWRPVATEIIVADQMSHDETPQIAQRLGCKLFQNNPPNGNFDLNRKLAMQLAQSDWILYMDTDERPTLELVAEVREFLSKPLDGNEPHGIKIPNIFYFIGKPLKHGIFNKRSAEIRMVRNNTWEYPCEDGFHRGLSVKGKVIRFAHPYKHFNVNSLSEWFIKTNQDTELDANKVKDSNQPLKMWSAFWDAWKFFVRHYIFKLGFLDGFHGLVSVFYFMLYHLTLKVKIWEKRSYKGVKEERDYLKSIEQPYR